MHKISPFLWFDDQAEQAANLYVSLFGDAKITGTRHWGPGSSYPEGSVMSVGFQIDGRDYQAFNGGPGQKFTPATSFMVTVDTQEEVDALWDGLTANGGEPGPCGWLTDPFGFSWQIVPAELETLLSDPDAGRASRALQAMLKMSKLDVAALKAAADG
jgi:predicted 3-demethylubiquinone-9 3-methyltransferase (glyoxalase superfamily)